MMICMLVFTSLAFSAASSLSVEGVYFCPKIFGMSSSEWLEGAIKRGRTNTVSICSRSQSAITSGMLGDVNSIKATRL